MLAYKKAFTLVELLVVIAIIAMLLSILMPALSKVRDQGRSVVCSNNARQIATGTRLYVEGNNGRIFVQDGALALWYHEIAPYLGDNKYKAGSNLARNGVMKIMFCPAVARLSQKEIATTEHRYGTNKRTWVYTKGEGSYGMNCFLSPEFGGYQFWGGLSGEIKKEYYITNYLTAQGDIAAFGDSSWLGGWPMSTQLAPRELQTGNPDVSYGIGRFCIDRHKRAINITFVDTHTERVRLEKLWATKWHNKYQPKENVKLPQH